MLETIVHAFVNNIIAAYLVFALVICGCAALRSEK